MIETTTPKLSYIQPDYYPEFRCLASECPDTCCKGWIIQVEPEALENWNRISERVRRSSDCCSSSLSVAPSDFVDAFPQRNHETRYQIRLNEKGECPMLTENGLCSVVMAHGHEMTPKICRDYPRQENESEDLIQRAVSVRCAPVLDLLWKHDSFQYEVIADPASPEQTAEFPAKKLLDGFLSFGMNEDISSAEYLSVLFLSLYKMHKKLEALQPVDAAGFRDYGQEMLSEENMHEVLDDLPGSLLSIRQASETLTELLKEFPFYQEELFHTYHDQTYDVMQNFFDSPVFGPAFTVLYQQSEKLLEGMNEETVKSFLSQNYLPADTDHKMKLLIMEELFVSILSIEVTDYESILVRLQWLVLQYLVIRYLLFLDSQNSIATNEARIKYHISRIFRVTELQDIMKIAFFDSAFTNWLWSPEYLLKLLL